MIRPGMAKRKRSEHYVNNKEFTQAVAEHNEAVKLAVSKGETPPRMSDYIGECIYKIATRLSTRPNFINYTYRDEMICDAIENCIQYIRNFNREKSDNAFAYVTQICYYAFLRRIQKEKKQAHVKNKYIENMNIMPEEISGEDFDNPYVEYLQKNFLPEEDVYKPKKKKEKPKGLELFYNEDSTDN